MTSKIRNVPVIQVATPPKRSTRRPPPSNKLWKPRKARVITEAERRRLRELPRWRAVLLVPRGDAHSYAPEDFGALFVHGSLYFHVKSYPDNPNQLRRLRELGREIVRELQREGRRIGKALVLEEKDGHRRLRYRLTDEAKLQAWDAQQFARTGREIPRKPERWALFFDYDTCAPCRIGYLVRPEWHYGKRYEVRDAIAYLRDGREVHFPRVNPAPDSDKRATRGVIFTSKTAARRYIRAYFRYWRAIEIEQIRPWVEQQKRGRWLARRAKELGVL